MKSIWAVVDNLGIVRTIRLKEDDAEAIASYETTHKPDQGPFTVMEYVLLEKPKSS